MVWLLMGSSLGSNINGNFWNIDFRQRLILRLLEIQLILKQERILSV